MLLLGAQSSRSPTSAAAAAVLTRAGTLLTPGLVARVRAGIGVAMVVRPTLVPEVLGVDRPAAQRTGWAVQMLGAREVALGVGPSVALRRADRRGSRLWVAVSLLADAVDALALARATGRGDLRPVRGAAAVATAVGAAATQAAALARAPS
jgi:hypothetical protein